MAKPTSKHRPEFARFVAVGGSFIDPELYRYHFKVPSGSNPGEEYNYLVNSDGSAPYCSRHDPNIYPDQYGQSCYLCDPDVAREMAERGRAAANGEPIPVGF